MYQTDTQEGGRTKMGYPSPKDFAPGALSFFLKRKMKDRLLCPADLERKSGIGRATVLRIVSGEHKIPHTHTLRALANALAEDQKDKDRLFRQLFRFREQAIEDGK